MNLIRHMYSEITPLKLLPHYPEANESANNSIPSEIAGEWDYKSL